MSTNWGTYSNRIERFMSPVWWTDVFDVGAFHKDGRCQKTKGGRVMGLKVSVGLSESAAKVARQSRIAKSLVLLTSPLWRPVGAETPPMVALPLLEAEVGKVGGPGPWTVGLQRVGGGVHGFRVYRDGSVKAFTERAFEQVWGPGSVRVPKLRFLGAHPGSGVSTWTQLLSGAEVSVDDAPEHPPVVVARSTLAGIDAAKAHARTAGVVLLVADAPGSVSADVRRGIRVLSGAIAVVRAPWVNALRGVNTVPDTPALTKVSAAVMTSIAKQWRYAQ